MPVGFVGLEVRGGLFVGAFLLFFVCKGEGFQVFGGSILVDNV